jgi:hypothetical protein
LALLKDPVRNEPIALTLGDLWTQVADSQGKNFIALIPDSLINTASGFLRTDRAPDQVLEAAKTSWKMNVTAEENWLTIAPKSRLKSRNERIDRVALKNLIDAIVKKGSPRLDDIALYATRSPVLANGSFDIAIIRAIDPASSQAVSDVYGQDRDMLLLFASLGSGTRQNLAKGQPTPVSSVATTATALVADMTFNSPDGPRVAQQQSTQANNGASGRVPVLSSLPIVGNLFQGQQGGPQVRQGRGPGSRGDMNNERTEILPRGVPSGSFLVLQTKNQSVAKAVRKDAGLSRIFTGQSMAFEKSMASAPQPTGNQNPRPTIAWDGYIAGNQYVYTFVFTLAPGVTLTRTLEDTSFDPGAKPVSADNLPAQFLDQMREAQKVIEARMAEMAQRQQDRGGNQQGGRGGRQARQNRQKPPAF